MSTLFQTTWTACQQIDVVIANAGLQSTSFWREEIDEEGNLRQPDWKVIDTNLKGIMTTAKLALHYFDKNPVPGGRCVIVTSPEGYLRGSKQNGSIAEYIATEHGVSLTQTPLTLDCRISPRRIAFIPPPQFTDLRHCPMANKNHLHIT
jgi:NAD(P)-dependent dehydrogenase (short-subunit alcohol dehydrogenase family)